MLQVARLAPRLLRDSSALVRDFLLGRLHEEGGFVDREGKPDLYYTVFGIEGLLALQEEPPAERILPFLSRFGDGGGLDLVHLSALARCHAGLGGGGLAGDARRAMAGRLACFRGPAGGFGAEAGSGRGTAYGCFLALGAHQDLGAELPAPEEVRAFLAGLETADGGYANDPGLKEGSTTATAAAVALLRNLGFPSRPEAGDWLLARGHPAGGFLAAPQAPLPDLLSTAVALHALAGLERSFEALKEPCLDFVDSLWTNEGGFHGHWADGELDCEYTYYGLLALGHLGL
jgi:prenyltransferase beta subunit